MVTRTDLVAKNEHFSPQNGDEFDSRRQNRAFFTSKRRREQVSSSKIGVFQPKMVTSLILVAKIECFSSKNGDENKSRRQKLVFSASKR
ncbi:hypothetical protein NSS89_05555 [Caldifermentibacillus hisashii]|uniref:hypothetical protein n=1 Tax=Caldifermentibacillus hisashii TaxID=996558 RepID=UPI0031FCA5F7